MNPFLPMRGAIRSILSRFGYEVKSRNSSLRSLDHGLRLLSSCIRPRSVIDIGVASGTPPLYFHFPPSSIPYLLVEPDPYHVPALDALALSLPAAVERVACGSSRGEAVLHAFTDHRKSSLGSPLRPLRHSEDVVVALDTLDNLVRKHRLPPPYLVKIDVEGGEADVIRGGADSLLHACGAIIEVSFVPRFANDVLFSDIVCLMKERGFDVFDIVAGAQDAAGRLYQADVLFIRHDLS